VSRVEEVAGGGKVMQEAEKVVDELKKRCTWLFDPTKLDSTNTVRK